MNLIKIAVFAFLLGTTHWAMALKSDSEQPVYIDSNTASYDDQKSVSIYTGDVVTIQGSLHINSDKLVVHLKNGDIEKLVFTGKPAKFRQLPGKGKDEIHGEGLTGEYYPSKNKLILIEEAVVSQGNKKTNSKLIIYDSKNSLIKAGEKASGKKRVTTVIMPRAKQQQNKAKGQVKKKEEETKVENGEGK